MQELFLKLLILSETVKILEHFKNIIAEQKGKHLLKVTDKLNYNFNFQTWQT